MNIARAIDLLEDIQTGEGTVFEVTQELAEAARMAIEELAAEGWIPVEELLPGNSEIILVTRKCRNGKMYVGQDEYYDDTGFESGADEDIIAWMPLPEPYKPEN